MSDGFNILISADAGPSTINLEIDNTRLSIHCSLSQFEVDLTFTNCNVDYGKDYGPNRASNSLTFSQSDIVERGSELGMELGVKVDRAANSLALSGKASRGTKSLSRASVEQNKGLLRHISIGTVSVAHPTGNTLDFSVPEYEGWFARPIEVGEPMAVTAIAGVRSEWISFKDPEITKIGKWGRKIEKFLRGDAPQQMRDRELFNKLLSHLVRIKLQDPYKTELATLAGAAMIFVPTTDKMAISNGPNADEVIELQPRLISKFLAATADERVALIAKLDSADETKSRVTSERKTTRSEFVAPAGTAANALSALFQLAGDDEAN